MTNINWKFKNWVFTADGCVSDHDSVKFTPEPPDTVKKIWEVMTTTEDLKIKCNRVEVLHFIYQNYSMTCVNKFNKKVGKIYFYSEDSATKAFTSELQGTQRLFVDGEICMLYLFFHPILDS